MKTPRDILFARHQTAAPKLDAIRCEVVAGLNHQGTKTQRETINLVSWCLGGSNKLWLELIWPCRRIWTGLVTIWILIFVVNFSQQDKSELMARKTPPPSPEMILAFRQQERLLAELIGPDETRVAEPPKIFSPRPSSERRFETLMT
ncbi:MAG TPA: hypothetical protein VGH42_08955 [Verrucomicrobiae bacterium]|jgi:hypothetical protein